MADNQLFYYFGDDEVYFRALQTEFARSSRQRIDLKRFFETDEKKIQSLFLKVYNHRAVGVFIDFSKHPQDYLHLARIISRTKMEHQLITVGLIDYLSPPELMRESIATGVSLTHIKGGETFDLVFDVIKLVSPNDVGEHGFASAALKEDIEAGIPVKVGFVADESLHFETNYPLQKGDRIRVDHHWTEKRVVPSRELFVTEVSTKNLFYHFDYAVDAEFLFVDEFLPPEGMTDEKVEERKREREDLIVYHKKQLSKWLEDNESRSEEKRAKVLVIDRNFEFYNLQTRTDKHSYSIRILPFVDDIGAELDMFQPQVIGYVIEKVAEDGDKSRVKNTYDHFCQIVNAAKTKFPDNLPFFVLFHSELKSKDVQDALRYPQILATDTDFEVSTLAKMSEMFTKKIDAEKKKEKSKGRKIFLKKTHAASLAEILIPITITKISETDLIFQSELPVKAGMNLHLKKPVEMFIHVQPAKAQGKIPEFYGLIHCMGEANKKELRRFVNSVFFRDHDAQVQAETEEFKKLNEAKLVEKQEAEKKAVEEANASNDGQEEGEKS